MMAPFTMSHTMGLATYNPLAADGQHYVAQHDQPHDVEHASSKYVTSKHCLRDPAVCMPEPGHHIGGLGWHPEDETLGDDLPPVF